MVRPVLRGRGRRKAGVSGSAAPSRSRPGVVRACVCCVVVTVPPSAALLTAGTERPLRCRRPSFATPALPLHADSRASGGLSAFRLAGTGKARARRALNMMRCLPPPLFSPHYGPPSAFIARWRSSPAGSAPVPAFPLSPSRSTPPWLFPSFLLLWRVFLSSLPPVTQTWPLFARGRCLSLALLEACYLFG